MGSQRSKRSVFRADKIDLGIRDEAEMGSQRSKRSVFRADKIDLGIRGEATRKKNYRRHAVRQFWRAPSILVEFMELGRQPFVLFNGKQTLKSLNRQNGFRMTLERLSCHKDFKITQAQTKVSFFYLNPLLQVEFRAIFEPFSYIV